MTTQSTPLLTAAEAFQILKELVDAPTIGNLLNDAVSILHSAPDAYEFVHERFGIAAKRFLSKGGNEVLYNNARSELRALLVAPITIAKVQVSQLSALYGLTTYLEHRTFIDVRINALAGEMVQVEAATQLRTMHYAYSAEWLLKDFAATAEEPNDLSEIIWALKNIQATYDNLLLISNAYNALRRRGVFVGDDAADLQATVRNLISSGLALYQNEDTDMIWQLITHPAVLTNNVWMLEQLYQLATTVPTLPDTAPLPERFIAFLQDNQFLNSEAAEWVAGKLTK